MKRTLKTSEMVKSLITDTKANWSESGAYAIIKHLQKLERAEQYDMEFNRNVIRGDYKEYSSIEEVQADYPSIDTMRKLKIITSVIEFEGGFVIFKIF